MKPRMKNPAYLDPRCDGAAAGARRLVAKRAVAAPTLALVHLRTSQINGCSLCVDLHARALQKLGERDERIVASARGGRRPGSATPSARRWRWPRRSRGRPIAARSSPTSCGRRRRVTSTRRLWAQLLLNIALTNLFNRLNAPTRQVAGSVRWDG